MENKIPFEVSHEDEYEYEDKQPVHVKRRELNYFLKQIAEFKELIEQNPTEVNENKYRQRQIDDWKRYAKATQESIDRYETKTDRENRKNYEIGMSFTPEQRAFLDKFTSRFGDFGVWNNDSENASDVEIINKIRDFVTTLEIDKSSDLQDSPEFEEFHRLFPRPPEYVLGKIEELTRDLSYVTGKENRAEAEKEISRLFMEIESSVKQAKDNFRKALENQKDNSAYSG